MEKKAWDIFIGGFDSSNYSGFVEKLADAEKIIKEYSCLTCSTFVVTRSTGKFGESVEKGVGWYINVVINYVFIRLNTEML